MYNQARRTWAWTWVLGLILMTGCSEGTDPTVAEVTDDPGVWDGEVASVTVSPSNLTLETGQRWQLTVTVRDAAGNVLTGGEVRWYTSNGHCVAVTSTGRLTARTPPGASISAVADGIIGKASITVERPETD